MVDGGAGGGSGGSGGIATGGSGGGPGSGGAGGGGGVDPHVGLPGTWNLMEFEGQPDELRLYEGVFGTLDFPLLEWEACGTGCESMFPAFGEGIEKGVTVGTIPSSEGRATAVVGITHWFAGGAGLVRRVVNLTDGSTMGAYVLRKADPEEEKPLGIGVTQGSATSSFVIAGSPPRALYASLDSSNGWLFREPWDGAAYRPQSCLHFDLYSSPTAYFFACGLGLEVMLETSEVTVLPDSEGAFSGDGNHGLAVWAQHDFDTEPGERRRSRIRAWAPGQEVRELAEVEGLVCGLGTGAEKVVGLHGEQTEMGTGCFGGLTEAKFFHLPREGGALVESPRLAGKAWNVSSASVEGDYMAVLLSAHPFVPAEYRWKVVLIRLSDWTMRAFPQPKGRSITTSAVALDGDHLYFSMITEMSGNFGFDRIYRYRLDEFDQIGEPFDPATAVPEEYR